jgi:electron transfer flavoprotein alpha subunit
MKKYSKPVWVVCGTRLNANSRHIRQLLSKTRELTNEVAAICVSEFEDHDFLPLYMSGATQIVHCGNSAAHDKELAYILCEMVGYYRPELVIFPANSWGRCCASEIAVLLGGGLTADCIDVKWSPDKGFIFTRAALSSSVLASIFCINTQLSMCTIKANIFPESRFDISQINLTIERFQLGKIPNIFKPDILSITPSNRISDCNSLDGAKLIFGFGRGVKDVSLFEKAAHVCGAKIAGSRAVVEAGFLHKDSQVGQSGLNVAPAVYVAFGISGASQHMVGVKNAKTIIAVNNDAKAPIFSYADYTIEEDCHAILSELVRLGQKNIDFL